ncbi:hypothetical protein RND71_016704 [Anisodus tanguticus]|uniref:Uncharacterized protein n=1 Tax=Anisodus tanguticus TaxID=243964 RepID=A0AAE1SAB7_9SOLA|nr:hypothetical protein RND71_016704 [Anisodus tanguticus]
MKIHYPSFQFLLIMVILSTIQLSSWRKIQEITPTNTQQRFNSRFSWHNSAPAPKKSRNEDDIDQSYRVSHRTVPGGPNPLHN